MFAGPSLIAWVFGDSMRYRRAYYTNLEDRAARLEAERDAQAQIAAAAERARIARELHDVVAHNVSVMVVQADGASYALGSDPDRARQALAAISATGRQALAEMRRMLGVLRRDEDGTEPGRAPLPGIGQLGELLEQARATGLAVSFTVEGVPQPLPDGAALAAYRIVQESLTNTRKHGGPRATAEVTLRYLEDALLLRIADDGRGAAAASDGAGHGLTGMRERVAVYGGWVQAGPRPSGGYHVAALLPLVAPAPQAAYPDASRAGAA
jgi:signal transduction histidine kinase